MRTILRFAAVVEIATGLGLVVAPGLVVALLVQGDATVLALLLARVLGITLVALGLACWPARGRTEGALAASRGMLTYNSLVALFLAYVGAALKLGGPLLWPVVALHGLVAVLLSWSMGSQARHG